MTVSLDSALSGLRAAQQSLAAVSTNIANASTPGYSRKTLQQTTFIANGAGAGVTTGALVRKVDSALIADISRQTSAVGLYSVRQKYLSRLQDFHGPSDAGRALSAQADRLASSFVQLSSAPDSLTLLGQTLSTAQQTAQKINDFANLLSALRTQAEQDVSAAVADVNQLLSNIAGLNREIAKSATLGGSSADLEDQRDLAVKKLSQYMDVATYKNGQELTVITRQGATLANTTAATLSFQPGAMSPTSYYPGGGLNGLTLSSAGSADITTGLGGQLGALFDLRDKTLPQYQAQLDEFAQKLAERFQNEGLRLFTDLNGNVPASVADPGSTLSYVGFSSIIRVNDAVVRDPTLIRNGTTGRTEDAGSNEVIRRIAQFAFGAYQYQQAVSNVLPGGDLMAALNLSGNAVTGSVDLASYAPDLSTLPGATFPGTFDITLGALPTQTITVAATDTAADLVGNINAAFGATVASLNGAGQLVLSYPGDITLADGGLGLAALGLGAGTAAAPAARFQVQIGTRPPVAVSINSGDTAADLVDKLNAIPGVSAGLNGAGRLVIWPSDGGDLKVTDAAGAPLQAMGVSVSNVAHAAFRQSHVGADGTLSTGLLANATLADYASSLISAQSEDARVAANGKQQEQAFLQTLETRHASDSGVDIDQELSELIRIQTAYGAASKMIAAAQKLFDDLLSSVG